MKERIGLAVVGLLMVSVWAAKCGHRPTILPLGTSVDGHSPAHATRLVVFLHGYGGSLGSTDWVFDELRHRGVPTTTSLVMVNGPFSSFTGRHWGDGEAELDESYARLRVLIAGWARANPTMRIYVGGFSQGAGVAERLAANAPEVTGLIAFSGCVFVDVPVLVAKDNLDVLVAHGTNDQICNFGVGAGLAEKLRSANREVTFVEHAENHSIPPVALDAMAAMLSKQ